MPSGAAIPKTCEGHKPRNRSKGGNVAIMCANCGEAPVKGYFTPKMALAVCEAWKCEPCGYGQLIPVRPDDCAELTPELMGQHRVFQEAERDDLTVEAAPDDLCLYCGWQRPATGNPEYWHCPKCQHVNGWGPDGSRTVERAPYRSVEWERAMGMRLDKPAPKPKRRKVEERASVSIEDDIPF